MDRRSFLLAGAAASALAVAAKSQAAAKTANPQHFALGHHDGTPHGVWRTAAQRPHAARSTRLRFALLGAHKAHGEHVLRAMHLDLLYRVAGVEHGLAPYRWAHVSRHGLGSASQGLVHEVEADQIAAIRVRYELADAAVDGEVRHGEQLLSLSDAVTPLLTPGYYAVLGPRASTLAPPAWREVAAPVAGVCALDRCDGAAVDFDTVLVAVEAV